MAGAPTSCDNCAKSCKHTPADQCRTYQLHGESYSLCDPCAQAGAPLLKPEPIFGTAPDNGTETSRDAARANDHKVTQQCLQTLGVLATFGPKGAIREQIEKASLNFGAKVTNQALCGRLNTLMNLGLVHLDDERRMADTRMTQQIYLVTAFVRERAAA